MLQRLPAILTHGGCLAFSQVLLAPFASMLKMATEAFPLIKPGLGKQASRTNLHLLPIP